MSRMCLFEGGGGGGGEFPLQFKTFIYTEITLFGAV